MLLTPRILLRPPRDTDAQLIFECHASDPKVTRFVHWPRHSSIDENFECSGVASTGYVLAQREWGVGLASEALQAMVALADALEVRRLYARCHAQHAASIRVLKKCGFEFEALLEKHSVFPNFEAAAPQDVHRYVHPSRNRPASVA